MNPGAAIRIGLFAICSIFGVVPQISSAQHTPSIVVDGSLAPARPLGGPYYMITADLGKQMGNNLFHSFTQFGLAIGETATFNPPPTGPPVTNVIGRVTGGSPSSINGQINSNIPNLYLINPSGIVFGANGTVNVSGSFHASTADYIKMSDGARFQATNPGGSTLSAATPAAFGFLNVTPGMITVNGSRLDVSRGSPGQTLGLVGGPVSIQGAALSAHAGTIRVTSVAGPGEVPAVKRTGGKPTVAGYGPVEITNSSRLDVSSGGNVFIRSGALTIDGSEINGDNRGSGPGGRLVLRADGDITLSRSTTVHADVYGSGTGGAISVKARNLSISNASLIESFALQGLTQNSSTGNGGDISVKVTDALSIDGGSSTPGTTGIQTKAKLGTTGTPGNITVGAGNLSVMNGGTILSSAFNLASAGSILVNAGALDLQSGGQINSQTNSQTNGTGAAGAVTVNAATASISGIGEINAVTFGSGDAGAVRVSISGNLTIVGPSNGDIGNGDIGNYTGIGTVADPGSTGNAGSVTVNAGSLWISGLLGQISSSTLSLGAGGDVSVNVVGPVSITGPRGNFPTGIVAGAFPGIMGEKRTGRAGSVAVTAGSLSIVDGGEISSTTFGTGAGGSVSVMTPGPLLLNGKAQIAASAEDPGSGPGGSVMVNAGTLTIKNGAQIASTTAGPGDGGTVQVVAQGPLTLTDPGTKITASSTANGNAGSVMVGAPQITIAGGAEISSTTAGLGNGGSVDVTTPGALVLDGMGVRRTRIAASADLGALGRAGELTVAAGNLTIRGGAQIASSTAGPGRGGDVGVMVANGVSLSGTGPDGASGITTSAEPGSSGDAGQVVLKAGGAIALSGGAEVASSTAGAGKGGTVQVVTQGALTLSDPLSGIVASTTSSGNAGSVMVGAPQIRIAGGAEISSTTAGLGNGGSVDVTTPGALVLDGMAVGGTRIAASADQGSLGEAGDVTVTAGNLTVQGGAQIASSTAGPGKGGNVNVTVTSDILLPDLGPQITARSTGSGDAGSVTVSAARLLMNNGSAISTEAEQSTANARNITINVRDFLYLVSSTITTSVSNKTGSGGNITIDPQFLILNHSSIIAEAIEGNGGNITISAGQYIPSADSIVSASSQLGISGNVVINGPLVDVNGALVVLSSELRSAAQVLRTSCAAQATRPQSTLVEGGRGGLPQDPDTTLPALYFADRDLNLNSKTGGGASGTKSAQQTRVHLTMHCG